MFEKLFGGDSKMKMFKWGASALFFLSIFLVVEILVDLKKMPSIGDEVYPQSTIMVSGSGEAYAIPDIATFDFSVTEVGKTVKDAQEKVDAKIIKALTAVREAGIEDKDIKTTGYNVYPKYEYQDAICAKPEIYSYSSVSYCSPSKRILTGYEASQSIAIKVRDTEKAGDLVTQVGASGVSNISGIQFSVDNRDQYVAKARAEAIAEAKAKAKVLAKQLGVRLGKIMYYSENGYPVYSYAEGKGGGEDMAISSITPARAELPTGETKITSEITITYEIK